MQVTLVRWQSIVGAFFFTIPLATMRSPDLKHLTPLDPEGSVVMLWTPDHDSNEITIMVEARTRGWAAVGFSPNGGMNNADIIMGWVNDGQLHVQDMHGIGNQAPVSDHQSDVEVLGGWENETHTVFTFKRLLETCDTKHDMDIGMDTSRVIWAWNPEDPDTPSSPRYHQGNRGVRSISLDGSGIFQYPDPEVTEYFEIRNQNALIPGDKDTMYYCSLRKIPDFGQKVHFTGYQVVLEPATAAYVHHMDVYECVVPEVLHEVLDQHVRTHPGAECYTPNMPAQWNFCKHIMIAWAVGGEGDMLPENVGMPLGHQYGSATYLMVETHYDNPRLHSAMRDNSGLRLFYTRSLRPVEAGLIQVGHQVTSTQFIPPGRSNFVSSGVCLGSCTEKYLPEEGVTVHSVVLHAHLAGRKIKLRHIRNGTELAPIASDRSYDFNYQQAKIVQEKIRINAGDTLILECEYDTTGRRGATFGGYTTRNEMCLAFIAYYPRVGLTSCSSQPHLGHVLHAIGIQNITLYGQLYPAVEGGMKWQRDSKERAKNDLKGMTSINSSVQHFISGDSTRDDFFNRDELRSLGVCQGSGRPEVRLYDYMTGMTWTEEAADRLQQLTIGGEIMAKCSSREDAQDTSGPHPFPQFAPREQGEYRVCTHKPIRASAQSHLPAQLPTILSLTAALCLIFR